MEKMNNADWARVPGTNYLVSTEGQVRTSAGFTCHQFDDGGGLFLVRMKINGLFYLKHVDQLVAEAFVDNPHGYAMIEHLDGNTHNNRANNLVWGLKFSDVKKRNELRKPKKGKPSVYQYSGDKLVGVYKTAYEASVCTGISRGCIYKALNKPNRTAHGYIFKTEKK